MEKVLIIDDEAPMRKLLRINLEDRYIVYDTGDSELALAAALQYKPNAILLDLRMPNYSGFELCRTFKSMSFTQLIPILIVTGEGGASTKSYCEELGATAFFEKPVDFAALRDGLEKALRAAQPERRSEVRICMRVLLKVRGKISRGNYSRKNSRNNAPPKTSAAARSSAAVKPCSSKMPKSRSPS